MMNPRAAFMNKVAHSWFFYRTTWREPWLKEYDCGVFCKGERPG